MNLHGSLIARESACHIGKRALCMPSGRRADSVLRRASTTTTSSTLDMKERMQFLKEDLQHLFDEQGVDATQYDEVVTFLDPITKYSNVQGYMFNIKMLKSVFDPLFELHDIQQTAPYDITTRWTMTMKFTPADKLGLGRWWSPVITFTGTSTYGFNPANGKINRHIDTWDSIQNQTYFSFEAFGDFFKQLLQTYTSPKGLGTPQYTLLRRAAAYQVRRYQPFLVVEAPLDWSSSSSSDTTTSSSSDSTEQPPSGSSTKPAAAAAGGGGRSVNPASAGVQAFRALVGYISGSNAASRKFAMTTPVLTSSSGKMQFMIDPSAAKALEELPAATRSEVEVRQVPGGDYAAAVFNGVATPSKCNEVEVQLRQQLQENGLQAAGSEWLLARYNDPSVKPTFRRNEVLIPLTDFDVWAEPKA